MTIGRLTASLFYTLHLILLQLPRKRKTILLRFSVIFPLRLYLMKYSMRRLCFESSKSEWMRIGIPTVNGF